MTYAEAKDHAAFTMANRNYSKFDDVNNFLDKIYILKYAGQLMEEAAALAIASAREEARNGYFRDGYALGYECGNTDGACGTSHANKVPTDKEIDDYLQEPLTAQA